MQFHYVDFELAIQSIQLKKVAVYVFLDRTEYVSYAKIET